MGKDSFSEELTRFSDIYARQVLSRKVRRVELLGRKCVPRIIRTFLGHELVMGKKRLTCPDMTTTRYLRLFAEVGLKHVWIPYNPVDTANILPELEASFKRLQALLSEPDSKQEARDVYRRLRSRLKTSERRMTQTSAIPSPR